MKELLIAINAADWLYDIKCYEDYLAAVNCTHEEEVILAQLIATAQTQMELLGTSD